MNLTAEQLQIALMIEEKACEFIVIVPDDEAVNTAIPRIFRDYGSGFKR